MSPANNAGRFLIGPADGTPVDPAIIQKVRRDDLPSGGLGIIEGLLAPGELIPPHVHAGVDEVTYVLAGEITAEIGGEVVVAPAGSYVLKPYGIMHAFWNSGDVPARVMEMHLPGGFEQFYVDARSAGRDGMRELADRYGVRHHPELIDDLKRRHHLP